MRNMKLVIKKKRQIINEFGNMEKLKNLIKIYDKTC